ncbi:hypothetical protein FAZ69_08120 [Trinickia terrae]|uniref:Uncharacterized protein n=1 Tax=Trinickia terrae TaxID=2571161 RepID=A0A4U1I9L4_9BURK|nr:hypothetical protein [Trinickia terrae]TKC90107.1 hypothetical protein FAZ69_08120 [Trinickia terrae]
MDRLARLLPFRQFGRLRHLRGVVPCAPLEAPAALTRAARLEEQTAQEPALPSALPAFARVSLNSTLTNAEPARRGPVRVYHGTSRFIMVGTIDAVCRMIDRCIAAERSGAQPGLFD